MIKYFSMDLGFVVNFSCNLDLLQSCVHFLLEVIAIFNDARLSLYDVNVGEVSRSVILSYLIIFKDDFFSYFSYDHKAQRGVSVVVSGEYTPLIKCFESAPRLDHLFSCLASTGQSLGGFD